MPIGARGTPDQGATAGRVPMQPGEGTRMAGHHYGELLRTISDKILAENCDSGEVPCPRCGGVVVFRVLPGAKVAGGCADRACGLDFG